MPESKAELLASANEAAGLVQKVFFTYLLVSLYLAVLIGSTTHEQMLRESGIQLPLFGVGLSVFWVYAIAPWLYLALHVNLLVQHYFLSRKLEAFNRALRQLSPTEANELRVRLYPSMFAQMLAGSERRHFKRFVLSSIVFLTVAVAPIALLLWMQIRFLPYHSEVVTWGHRLALFADLALLWYYWPLMTGEEDTSWRQIVLRERRYFRSGVCAIVTLLMLWVSTFVAVVPRGLVERVTFTETDERRRDAALTCDATATAATNSDEPTGIAALVPECLRAPRRAIRSCFPRHLDVREAKLLAEEPHPEVEAALMNGDDKTGADSTAETTERIVGLPLEDRDLRGADFRHADLTKADLAGADLTGADLGCATLIGATLTNAKLLDANLSDAKLNGATLSYAELHGANLSRAVLEEATLIEIKGLETATLPGVRLGAARLMNTRLIGAKFIVGSKAADSDDANLLGTQLQGAQLQGAQLEGAMLRGANLSLAKLQGANLRLADLQGAILRGADLQGVDFRGASIAGADFANAKLSHADLSEVKDGTFEPSEVGEENPEQLSEYGEDGEQIAEAAPVRPESAFDEPSNFSGATGNNVLCKRSPIAQRVTSEELSCQSEEGEWVYESHMGWIEEVLTRLLCDEEVFDPRLSHTEANALSGALIDLGQKRLDSLTKVTGKENGNKPHAVALLATMKAVEALIEALLATTKREEPLTDKLLKRESDDAAHSLMMELQGCYGYELLPAESRENLRIFINRAPPKPSA